MTQIICRAISCLFWENGICTSEEIEYEPDSGCLTFQDMGDLELEEDDDDFDWEDDDDLFDDDDDNWEDEEDDWSSDEF
ncbi:MAG: hypothetical protein PVI09_04145 [Anaerolineae bacterium]|jgi:hypothetical protein